MSDIDWADTLNKVLPFAQAAKQKMIDRKLTRATKTCPECGGKVQLVLAGRRNHLHMACETPACIMRMME